MNEFSNFGLTRHRASSVIVPELVSDAPIVMENAEVLNLVCPVSSKTGNRMSLYDAIDMLGNEKLSRQIDALLPEIPSVISDPNLSDVDKISMLASRLETGSVSEDARVRERLASIVDDFSSSFRKSMDTSDEKIEFKSEDTPSLSPES